MRATGIIRRIDDLGRIVIPKEIRRSMKIREGDPIEIYVDHENGGLFLKKYDTARNLVKDIETLIDCNITDIPAEAVSALRSAVKILKETE